MRSAKLAWQNFDDPYSLYLFAKNTYQPNKQCGSGNNIEVVFDQQSSGYSGKIESALQGSLAVLNSKIEGKVIVEAKLKKGRKDKHFRSLFYNVQLPAERTLYVPPNHVVVGIDGRIFSTRDQLLP